MNKARLTKKEARSDRDEWARRLLAGLVVRYTDEQFPNGHTLISYPTVQMRDEKMAEWRAAGVQADIVQVGSDGIIKGPAQVSPETAR